MPRLVVGTAGHVDHGKTRLIQALTGIDCDRLAEEKARGITIDLGFAHLERGDVRLSFIDVPGHERFLHNALAGLGGIRAMLLVVAADEGVMPQTREHLAVCELLGLRHGLVVMTKSDLASADQRDLVELEIDDLLARTPFAGAPVLQVSSVTGEGIAAVEAALVGLAYALGDTDDDGLRRGARLAIDRAFVLQGQGGVVTGTLSGAPLAVGTDLTLLPAGKPVRVRGLHVHGEAVPEAPPRERVAVQLGGVEVAELERGMTLATPGTLAACRRLLVRVQALPDAPAPLRTASSVRVHLLSGESLASVRLFGGEPIEPGASGIVELRLAEPLAAARGDRVILRRPSPAATLGGGEILDPEWRRPRRSTSRQTGDPGPRPTTASPLAGLCGDDDSALLYWTEQQAERGATAAELAPRLGWRAGAVAQALDSLAADGRLLAATSEPRRYLAPAVYLALAERARRVLQEYFRRERLARGMPKAEAVKRMLPRGGELVDTILGWLARQGVLVLANDLVNLPGRDATLSGDESSLATAVLARFEAAGLEPPSPGEIRQALDAKPQILEGMIRYLHQRGRLVRLPGGLFLAAKAFTELRRDLEQSGWQRFTVAQFKERYKLTRKWAIPLLEQLDSTGATRRVGDERLIVRPGGAAAAPAD
jgi:selenocysteine-specific elongation factor